MRTRNPWPAMLARSVLALLLLLVLGWATGQWLPFLLLGAVGALAWNLENLRRLERWLRLTRKLDPPKSLGLWGEVFDGLYRMRRRARDRDRRRRGLVRRYRDSVKAMPDATVVLTGDYRIDWFNEAARGLLGLQWPRDEGQRISNILRHPDFVSLLEEMGREARTLALPSPVDGRIWLEIRMIPYAKKRHLLLARDTTALKRLETMRTDFIANVSHELRTPLTVVYGVAESLADEVADRDDLARPVELLREQTERMRHLVDDLLLLARLETGGAPQPGQWVDVAGLLASLVEEARTLSGARDHRIELDADAGLQVFGYPTELRSAFGNVLFNAVHYTPDGGDIRVRWFADARGGCFEVEDTGIGVETQHIARLTERFYRVDNGRSKSRGGTGLGLAIVKHVLMRHDAQLRVRSEPGKGSCFTCVFPARILRRSPNGQERVGT